MPPSDLPQSARAWMRQVDALLTDFKRHTHPSADPASLPALEARVSVLEGQMSGVIGDVAQLMLDLADVQVEMEALGILLGDLTDEVELHDALIATLFADVNDLQVKVNTDLMEEEPFTAYAPVIAGWTQTATQGWLRFGRMVQLTMQTTRNVGAGSQSASFTYGTLPLGARPVADLYFALHNSTATATGQDRRCHIATSGVITINGSADTVVTEGNSLSGSATYIVPA